MLLESSAARCCALLRVAARCCALLRVAARCWEALEGSREAPGVELLGLPQFGLVPVRGKPKASARQQPGGRTARRCVEAALRCSVRAVLRDAIDHQHEGVLRCAVALKLHCATPCRSCAALQRAMRRIKFQPAQTTTTGPALPQTIASVFEGGDSILRI